MFCSDICDGSKRLEECFSLSAPAAPAVSPSLQAGLRSPRSGSTLWCPPPPSSRSLLRSGRAQRGPGPPAGRGGSERRPRERTRPRWTWLRPRRRSCRTSTPAHGCSLRIRATESLRRSSWGTSWRGRSWAAWRRDAAPYSTSETDTDRSYIRRTDAWRTGRAWSLYLKTHTHTRFHLCALMWHTHRAQVHFHNVLKVLALIRLAWESQPTDLLLIIIIISKISERSSS